jgi:hypothetical protein
MRRLPFLVLIALFLGACASSPVLRTLKDVREAYRPGDWAYIDSLLDASTQPNRDVQAASIDRLLRFHEALAELDPAAWPLDPSRELALRETDRKRERERILALKREAIAARMEQIERQFERLFALSTDFNVRNLCLWARSRCGGSNVAPFLARAINDNDPICSDLALKLLRPRLSGDFALGATFDVFARADFPVFSTALGNLLLYPPSETIRSALANYRDLTKDASKRRLLADALAAYPKVEAPPLIAPKVLPGATNTAAERGSSNRAPANTPPARAATNVSPVRTNK